MGMTIRVMDAYSNRIFVRDMEDFDRTISVLNSIGSSDWEQVGPTLNDWYRLMDLPTIETGDLLGWPRPKYRDCDIRSVLEHVDTDDGDYWWFRFTYHPTYLAHKFEEP